MLHVILSHVCLSLITSTGLSHNKNAFAGLSFTPALHFSWCINYQPRKTEAQGQPPSVPSNKPPCPGSQAWDSLHIGQQCGQAQLGQVFFRTSGWRIFEHFQNIFISQCLSWDNNRNYYFFFLWITCRNQISEVIWCLNFVLNMTHTPASFAVQDRGWHFPCIWEFLSSVSMVKEGSSKTFAIWPWGTCEGLCEEEKGERGLMPFGKLEFRTSQISVSTCVWVGVC